MRPSTARSWMKTAGPGPNDTELVRLKREKLRLKEEMERLRSPGKPALSAGRRRRSLRPRLRSLGRRRQAAAGGLDRGIEVGLGAQPQDHRVARLDVRAVPMGPVTHLGDGVLGGAEQLGRPPHRAASGSCAAGRRCRPAGRCAWTPACSGHPCCAAWAARWCFPAGAAGLRRIASQRAISSRVSWPEATGSKPTMPCATSPSAMAWISSGCMPTKSAIWSKESDVLSISHTAVAFGMSGWGMGGPRMVGRAGANPRDNVALPIMRQDGRVKALMGKDARWP